MTVRVCIVGNGLFHYVKIQNQSEKARSKTSKLTYSRPLKAPIDLLSFMMRVVCCSSALRLFHIYHDGVAHCFMLTIKIYLVLVNRLSDSFLIAGPPLDLLPVMMH